MTDTRVSSGCDYADLVRELHQVAEEHDRGHGPRHAAAANAIDHLMTLIRLMQPGSAAQAPTITDEMVQHACEVYAEVYHDDEKDMGDAMRAALNAALAQAAPDPSLQKMQRSLIAAKCTSHDGTVVHASMADVLRALTVPSTNCGPITTEQLDMLQFGRTLHTRQPKDRFTFSTAADMIDEAAATTNGFNLKEIATWLRALPSTHLSPGAK